MGKSRKTIQIIILFAVVLLGGYAIWTALFGQEGSGKTEAGDKPPAFSLADTSGSIVSLSDFEGQPVVINFWGSFCEPCVREMPEFERQYVKWKDQGLTILAINLSEDTLTVNNFVNRFKLTYPVLRDVDRRVERQYGLRQYPTTFFVKPDGSIMEVVVGGMLESDINQRVERLLEL
ncbi:redoxin domain-containing protein [Paenibacillus sp. PL2-23]|uniref:redoxin domain-containing protein n=1 Tax=Paenibacillus sp. PL2-23 TaxID=2100729 RepID=UPI0030F5AD18